MSLRTIALFLILGQTLALPGAAVAQGNKKPFMRDRVEASQNSMTGPADPANQKSITEAAFGSGVGPFKFGLTTDQVNSLFPTPFNKSGPLPIASEYQTAEVRYYDVPAAQLPPPAESGSPFGALMAFPRCWNKQSSIVFLFAQNQLTRISMRFAKGCPNLPANALELAHAFAIAPTGGNESSQFRRVLSHSTVEIEFDRKAAQIDVFQTGSPLPYQAGGQSPTRLGAAPHAAKLISQTPPVYPLAAKQEGIQGTVRMDVIIGVDGRVLRFVAIWGPPELRRAAMDAVKKWRYQPTQINGQAVEVQTEIDVNFVLGP